MLSSADDKIFDPLNNNSNNENGTHTKSGTEGEFSEIISNDIQTSMTSTNGTERVVSYANAN
jgi:hypothetical protein